MNTSSKTRNLVEAAMLLAMAMILSYIKVYELPQGGSITLEMLPIVVLALRQGTKMGCLGGFVGGAVIGGLLRFVCSFLSGWLLWGSCDRYSC